MCEEVGCDVSGVEGRLVSIEESSQNSHTAHMEFIAGFIVLYCNVDLLKNINQFKNRTLFFTMRLLTLLIIVCIYSDAKMLLIKISNVPLIS